MEFWIFMVWYYTGIIMLPMLFVFGKSTDTIGWLGSVICFIQMIPLIGSIFPTEKALRKTFDRNGNRL